MLTAAGLFGANPAPAAPHLPASDAEVLAELPAGARHADLVAQRLVRDRLDVTLPLARFYITRARATGDLRFLGLAQQTLKPWLDRAPSSVDALVLDATRRQSLHEFAAALAELDRVIEVRPGDPQAWLTRATVLRVLGRYPDAAQACGHLAVDALPAVGDLCLESIRGLSGHLSGAYQAVVALSSQELPPEARAWRYSELGEMAARLGDDVAAEHWLREGLVVAPEDSYTRAALADLWLRLRRAREAEELLAGHDSMEPLLLRVAIAERQLHDPAADAAERRLAEAFEVEARRGEAVHRREYARFLLDVRGQPEAALRAAQENWQVQHEPDDVLILLRAARAAHRPAAAAPALEFLAAHGLEDARLADYGYVAGRRK